MEEYCDDPAKARANAARRSWIDRVDVPDSLAEHAA